MFEHRDDDRAIDRRGRAHRTCRSIAQGRHGAGGQGLPGGDRRDPDDFDRLVDRPRDADQEGAPADVFLSADTKNPVDLADDGFASGTPVDFAGNALTVIVPSDNPAGLTSPLDLAKDGVKVIAAGEDVPISRYASQVIDNLSQEPGAPADFAARVAANTVSKEDNVKAVVAKVELGEGDAAIVYVTDAAASDEVRSIDVPADANVPAIYAGIVVKASPNQEAAEAFLDWFVGPDGQAILASFGFLPAPAD